MHLNRPRMVWFTVLKLSNCLIGRFWYRANFFFCDCFPGDVGRSGIALVGAVGW